MREKLIELLYEARMMCEESYCANCEYAYEDRCMQAMHADHLIANGVTVRAKAEWEDYMPYIKYNPNNRITKKRCSECKSKASPFMTKFCPNCGADMRGEEHEKKA